MPGFHPLKYRRAARHLAGVHAELSPFLRIVLALACVFALLGEFVPALAALLAFAAGTAAALRVDFRRSLDGGETFEGRLAASGKRLGRSLAAAGPALFAGYLLVETLRGGQPGRSTIIDALLVAAACSAFLMPLGFPLEAAILLGRNRAEAPGRLLRCQLSCTLGMSAALYGAVLAGWLTPLTHPQILWANLVGTALPVFTVGANRTARAAGKPDQGRRLFCSRELLETLAVGLLLGTAMLAVFRLGLGLFRGSPEPAAQSRSLAFLTLCLAQALAPLFSVPDARQAAAGQTDGAGEKAPFPKAGAFLPTAAGLGLAAALFLAPPARAALGLGVLSPIVWLLAGGAAAAWSLGVLCVRFLCRRA